MISLFLGGSNSLTQNAHLTAEQASLIEVMECFTPFLFTNFGRGIMENPFGLGNDHWKRQVNDDAYLGSLKIVLWISISNTFFVGLQCSGILLTGEVVAGLL